MNLWNRTEVNLGKQSYKNTIKTYFTYLGNANIINLDPSCFCITATLNNNTVNVSYNPNKPNDKEYESFKFITVTLDDGTEVDLKINATITL